MNKMTDHQETPDIEVQADQYEEEQAVLRKLAKDETAPYCPKCDRHIDIDEEESGGNCARCHEPLDYPEDPYVGINSCDALRILDGVA